MLRKTTFVLTGLFALLMLTAFGRVQAQGTSSVSASGGVLFHGSYVAALVNGVSTPAGGTGMLSLTTSTAHIWGYVYRIDRVSSAEVHLFAHVYGQAATLEIDVLKKGTQNTIGFAETNDVNGQIVIGTGKNSDGSLVYLPLVGMLNIK